MGHHAADFATEEHGAVTVDFVVLTAAIVGMGLAVINVVSAGVQTASESLAAQLTGMANETSYASWSGGASAYAPYDQAFYDDLVGRLEALSDADLAIADAAMSRQGRAFASSVLDAGGSLSANERGLLDDMDGALATVTASRGLERNDTGIVTDEEAERVSTAMYGSVSTSFGG